MKIVGDKEEVYRGLAKHTAGGLTKKDLKVNNQGKVVSARKSKIAKKQDNLGLKGSGMRRRRARGSGVVGSLFDAIGLGVPSSRGGRKPKKARKAKGKGISKLIGLMSKPRKSKGKGVPRSRGGRKRKSVRGGAWYDDLATGFKSGVGLGTKIAGLIL